jgi:hypothetical protein
MAEQDEEEPPSSRRRPWRRAPAAASNDDNIMTNNNFHRLSRSPDDQVALSYSDDDSGSLSDAYFFPPGRQQNPESNSEDPLAMAYSPEPESLLRTEGEPLYYPRYTPVYTYGSLDTPPLVVQEGQAYVHAGQGVSNAAIAQHERMLSAPESRKYRHIRQKQIEMGERERAVKEIRGTPQDPKKCRDATFAILFLLQLILVFFAAIRFGSNVVLFDKAWTPWSRMTVLEADGSVGGLVSQVETSNDDLLLAGLHNVATVAPVKTKSAGPSLFTIDYQTVISLCGITGLYACILSLFSVGFMLIIARSLIQVSLVFSILLALAWGTIGYAIQPHGGVVPIMGFVALVMLVMYTIVVWERIPFAATNLYMALCAMRCTADITLIGVGTLFIAFAWCLIWGMAFIGIVDTLDECAPGDLYCQESIPHSHVFLYIALLFSFAWTNLVIKVSPCCCCFCEERPANNELTVLSFTTLSIALEHSESDGGKCYWHVLVSSRRDYALLYFCCGQALLSSHYDVIWVYMPRKPRGSAISNCPSHYMDILRFHLSVQPTARAARQQVLWYFWCDSKILFTLQSVVFLLYWHVRIFLC